VQHCGIEPDDAIERRIHHIKSRREGFGIRNDT
jgi:hypothetical protein